MAGDSSDEDEKRRQSPPPVEFVRPSEAQRPAPPRDQPPAAWVPRPEEFGQPPQQPFPQAWPQVAPRTTRPIIGGALLIISGLLGMVSTYLIFTQPLTAADVASIQNMTAGDLTANALLVFAVVYAQAFAILGGIMAIQRKNWKLAVLWKRLGNGHDRAVVLEHLDDVLPGIAHLRHVAALVPDLHELPDSVFQGRIGNPVAVRVEDLLRPLLEESHNGGAPEFFLDEIQRAQGHVRVRLWEEGRGVLAQVEERPRSATAPCPERTLDEAFRLEGIQMFQRGHFGDS